MIRLIFLLLSAISIGLALHPKARGIRANSGPREDPIGVTPPNFPGGEIANDAPPTEFFRDFQPPFPTDTWWSGFTVGNQDANVAGPFPYQCQLTNEGLIFGISDEREFDGASIRVPTQHDWTVGIDGLPYDKVHRKALSWDTQTVCLRYFTDDQMTSTFDTCLVPGSPYMTFTFKNAAVVITSARGDITSFEWVDEGTKARVQNDGGSYLIYVVDGSPIALAADQRTLSSPAGFSGTLRLVKVYDEPGQESILDAHSATYPTGLVMAYDVTGDVGTQTWTWETVGNQNDLLILSWPHHRKVLQAPNMADIQYLTLKGYMKGVVGNQWVLKHDLPKMSWFAENSPQQSCLPELVKTLEAEVQRLEVMMPVDFYFWGGSFARASRLALIAEHVGRPDLIDPVVTILKQSVQYWFDPAHVPAAAYETGWGGFINKEGWNNTWIDFGNAYYNDHHFHYGYLLHGAAVIGKYDPGWLNEHSDFFIHVARNVGNPSPNDPHYTVTRHMDFFAGHSWASGIANSAGPRDQESSGEAINGYYGLLLFAHAINNQVLIDYSRLLLAIEVLGVQTYWHLYPTINDPDTPFPEQEFRDLVTVGNVMDWQIGAWLFWGEQKIQITAIQILPLTPIGQYTFDAAWMQSVLPYCQEELDDVTLGDAFKSVIYAAYAKVDPQKAYTDSETLFDWGTGNSASNQLYFVATQPSSSDICMGREETPEGIYYIQDVATSNYVVAGQYGNLAATSVADALGTKFELKFIPGGSTIRSLSNDKFVSADFAGNASLQASRETAAAFEIFRWSSSSIVEDGIFELTAMVNRAKVGTVDDDSQHLVNNGQVSRYRLIETDVTTIQIPSQGVLKSVQTNQYVAATEEDPVLRAVVPNNGGTGEATKWSFEQVPNDEDNLPHYIIRSQTTNKIVTADQTGTVPLSAVRDDYQYWERFRIVPYKDAYIILHAISGMAAAVQADSTLIDNNLAIDDSALWIIE